MKPIAFVTLKTSARTTIGTKLDVRATRVGRICGRGPGGHGQLTAWTGETGETHERLNLRIETIRRASQSSGKV